MLKNILAAAIFTFSLYPAHAFNFRPTVSLLTNYTLTNNYTNISAGAFDIQNRKINFGLEFTHKFYLPNNLFIKTGFRYNTYQTVFYGKNQLSGYYDQPALLSWSRKYESFAVPIQFGKEFAGNNGCKGDFFIGFSAGIFSAAAYESHVRSGISHDPNSTDTTGTRSWDSTPGFPSSFFPTADFGASYHPIKTLPGFSMGIQCAIQLNKTAPVSLQGEVQNISTGETYAYQLQHYQSVINCSFLLSYTFGKPRPVTRKNNSLDCPR